MTTPAQICVVSSSNIDLITRVPRLTRLGETMVGHSFHLGYGGKGANQAVMTAKLGAQVTVLTKLGKDVFGEGTLKNYQSHNIDTTFVMFASTNASAVAPIFVDDHAQNFIVIVPGANNQLAPAKRTSPRKRSSLQTFWFANWKFRWRRVVSEHKWDNWRTVQSRGNDAPRSGASVCARGECHVERSAGTSVSRSGSSVVPGAFNHA